MSIINNANRVGNFTSSNIYKLMAEPKTKSAIWSDTALTYIEERNMERELGCSIEQETEAKTLQWGKMCEPLVNDELPTNYKLCSNETILHPDYDFWADSSDALIMSGDKKIGVAEIKCPATKKSWFTLACGSNIFSMVDGFELNGAKYSKNKSGAQYFWQCISHACCHNIDYLELIIFMPYAKDLQRIRDEAKFQGINWIAYSTDDELPHLPDNSPFKSITKMQLEVPKEYKERLTERVVSASKLLIEAR